MEGIIGVEFCGALDEDLSEVGEDAPVVIFIGVGQRGACDRQADAGVIEFVAERVETGFDVAQAVTARELREGVTALVHGMKTPEMRGCTLWKSAAN